MKKLRVILFIFLANFSFGQQLTNEIKTETSKDYDFVYDSVARIINKTNSIIIETCSGFSAFFITKDSSNWKGFYIISLAKGGIVPPDIGYVENGVNHIEKAMRTFIMTFNADTLYKELIKNKIYNVKQLTDKQLEDKYNEQFKSEDKNIRYGLPSSSHDCNITISTFGKVRKNVSYSNTIIDQKQLQKLPTIKIFKSIRKLLEQKALNYYR